MAEITFSLADLFERTFGYKTRAFDPKLNLIQGNGGVENLKRTEFGVYGSEYYTNDAQGREYFMPVKLTYYEKSNDNVYPTAESDKSGKEWNLPYPVISITSKKTIIETPLTERRGTVKELINTEDYEITIKGFIVSPVNEFPEKDVTLLRTIYEQNTAVSIKCPFTDIFLLRPDRSGSDRVVITSLTFPNITGVKNVRPYELRMVSDEPFSLINIKTP